MNAAQLQSSAIALLRSAVGWQTAIAKRLGVNPRRVREWLADDQTPPWVDAWFETALGGVGPTPYPRDEWIVGDAPPDAAGARREYIVHTAPPRFIARVVALDDDGDPDPTEGSADLLSGAVYTTDDSALCEIVWIDEPRPGEVAQLLEAAADALHRA